MGVEIDVNHFIPSFGDFVVYCHESDITLENCLVLMFELLNNPKKYDSREIIKEYLSDNLDIDAYITLKSKLSL